MRLVDPKDSIYGHPTLSAMALRRDIDAAKAEDPRLTVAQAAEFANVSQKTIRRAVKSGALAHEDASTGEGPRRALRIRKSDLASWLRPVARNDRNSSE